ncbi:amino acid permease, partial [Pseudomonas aeruginosa]
PTLRHDTTEVARLLDGDWIDLVPGFNIPVFCYSAHYIVPEMGRGLSHAPDGRPTAVISAMLTTVGRLSSGPLSVIALTGL